MTNTQAQNVIKKAAENFVKNHYGKSSYGYDETRFNHLKRQGNMAILTILKTINENPNNTPAQINTVIGNPKNWCSDTFRRIRAAELAKSEKGHYNITELGKDLLKAYNA